MKRLLIDGRLVATEKTFPSLNPATGEVLDQGLLESGAQDILRGAGAARYGSWISIAWFLAAHLDLRLDGVMRQDDVFHGQAQLHVYF